MYIKDSEYDLIAYTIMNSYIVHIKMIIRLNGSNTIIPKKVDISDAIDRFLPDKYGDEECEKRSDAIRNYWTKYNTKKLKKYVQTEITRRHLILALNINHIKEKTTLERMNVCQNILTN